eukprot:4533502-Prymnesium_polylepis.1
MVGGGEVDASTLQGRDDDRNHGILRRREFGRGSPEVLIVPHLRLRVERLDRELAPLAERLCLGGP